jgi:hypothetical protein
MKTLGIWETFVSVSHLHLRMIYPSL